MLPASPHCLYCCKVNFCSSNAVVVEPVVVFFFELEEADIIGISASLARVALYLKNPYTFQLLVLGVASIPATSLSLLS
jgi:hypothetical protein